MKNQEMAGRKVSHSNRNSVVRGAGKAGLAVLAAMCMLLGACSQPAAPSSSASQTEAAGETHASGQKIPGGLDTLMGGSGQSASQAAGDNSGAAAQTQAASGTTQAASATTQAASGTTQAASATTQAASGTTQAAANPASAGSGSGVDWTTSVDLANLYPAAASMVGDFSYAKLTGMNFSFLSGAGGWSTDLSIASDGSFSGIYHDSDMGDTGTDYPNGTMYYCEFSGKFGELTKVDDYTYKTQIVSMSYAKNEGETEIIDGVRFVYAGAYGLEDAGDMYFYLPGSKKDNLPEGFLSWVNPALYDFETGTTATELTFVGLYNEAQEEGFYSADMVGMFVTSLLDVQSTSKTLKNSIQNDSLTQTEYNQKAEELYTLWDDSLNDLWLILKGTLSESQMNTLLQEQRAWITDKEQKMANAEAEVAGGSMAPMQKYLTGAGLTEARVYELIKYLP